MYIYIVYILTHIVCIHSYICGQRHARRVPPRRNDFVPHPQHEIVAITEAPAPEPTTATTPEPKTALTPKLTTAANANVGNIQETIPTAGPSERGVSPLLRHSSLGYAVFKIPPPTKSIDYSRKFIQGFGTSEKGTFTILVQQRETTENTMTK